MLKARQQKNDHPCHLPNSEENIQPEISRIEAKENDGVIEIPASRQHIQNSDSLVGECVDDNHPTLSGRVRVQWIDGQGKKQEQWLPKLQNLPVRKNDRLLLVKPANWNEMVVTGVIDGYARRPEIVRKTAGQMQLETDEAIRVTTKDGQQLLELFQTDTGPTIRILQNDTAVEFPGKLKLAADCIELEAGAGPIHIKASDDVCINGEMIHLN